MSQVITTDQAGSLDLTSFNESGTVKHGLPPAAYTSEAFWDREKSTLFPNSWVFVGFAHEMDKPGDVIPVSVGDQPILLVRDKDDSINAFHNVCRHRCITLVEEAGNVGRNLRCPYHAWIYGLNGELKTTPYFGGPDNTQLPEGFEPKEHGLKPVQSATWNDWVFVNLNGNAEPFEEFIAPLKNRLDGLDFGKAKLVGVIDLGIVDTNWKFLMENFIEPYHVQFVHSSTTDQPLVDHYTVVDGKCLGSAVDLDESNEGGDGSGSTLAVSSRYLTLFPSFVFGRYFPDQMGVHLNTPVGPDKTHQRRAIYMTDGTELNSVDAKNLMDLWTAVHKEDHEITSRQQKGRKSLVAENGGLLSPHWEDSVRAFQELVIDAVK